MTHNQDDIGIAGLHFCSGRGVLVACKIFSIYDGDDSVKLYIVIGVLLDLTDLKRKCSGKG